MHSQDELPSISGERILVTCGAGFVGSAIADALAADTEVRVLDDLSSGSRSNVPDEATLIEGDVRDDGVLARATERPGTVVGSLETPWTERKTVRDGNPSSRET